MRLPARALAILLALPAAGCLDPDAQAGGPPGPAVEALALGVREADVGERLVFEVPDPVEDARYVWSFGDGGTALGERAEHAWRGPGRYLVGVQEIVGTETRRALTGFVIIPQRLLLDGEAVSGGGASEAKFTVGPNATSLHLDFVAQGAGDRPVRVVLADPSGAPQVQHALPLKEGQLRLEFEVERPDEGEWLLYVETGTKRLEWTAAGEVDYRPRTE